MRYCPAPSVVDVRLVSMSASLVASTATAGTGAPVESLTRPAIEPWARAAVGMIAMSWTSAARAFIDCKFQF